MLRNVGTGLASRTGRLTPEAAGSDMTHAWRWVDRSFGRVSGAVNVDPDDGLHPQARTCAALAEVAHARQMGSDRTGLRRTRETAASRPRLLIRAGQSDASVVANSRSCGSERVHGHGDGGAAAECDRERKGFTRTGADEAV
ncbi:uncharacterized protein M6B38_332135 [Iris pallida]|uniref:Uncharacterized protein n=1 Tax=Iris pallida TaxID=29817 RepID=A0AAX6H3P8_IRIPA|nr:uncharacterized protein M6B38_332135 [Iris pallida]